VQPWPDQQPESDKDQPSSDASTSSSDNPWKPPSSGSDQPSTDTPSWQPPAYTQQQYPPYQQPGQQSAPPSYSSSQQYPPTEQFGQQGQQSYPQQGQYGQPGQYPQYGQPGQYGQQPGQYGQQPGQQPGQYGQQPGQYGQYAPYTPPGAEQGSKRSMALVGGIVGVVVLLLLVVVGVLGFWKPGFFVTTKLDVSAAQTGVQKILTDETNGYGAKNVKDVKCNDGQSPKVKKGDTFTCEVSIDGTKRQVTVTFQDDNGTYEVGRPK
jgi:Domain of unknown function (DUF4333)